MSVMEFFVKTADGELIAATWDQFLRGGRNPDGYHITLSDGTVGIFIPKTEVAKWQTENMNS